MSKELTGMALRVIAEQAGCPLTQSYVKDGWCTFEQRKTCRQDDAECWRRYLVQENGREKADDDEVMGYAVAYLTETFDCPKTAYGAECPGEDMACYGQEPRNLPGVYAACWREYIESRLKALEANELMAG